MEPVRKTVWYIESHFAEPVSLDDVASVAGLSRFHLSRTFAQFTGRSVTAYLRARRPTEAAKMLAESNSAIVDVALACGYGSHEAFTRAFRDQFGVTPESVRKTRSLETLALMEPFIMPDIKPYPLARPAIKKAGPFLLAGLREFRTFDERAGIPGQWQRFGPHIGATPGEISGTAYGACFQPANGEEGFDYVTGVGMTSLDDIPERLSGARIEKHRFAVFPHNDHVSTIGATCNAAFNDWIPASGEKLHEGPLFLLEVYGPNFNPATGRGGIDVWLPLKG
ncbi:AraC family transcriptional regulator [Hyphococcus sp.]|uniref:AraC family transcriptional regulator n=1 Tax=Hyphococcus sp. TaxID=2038636 RepID=UPI00208472E7|nr:MAG: AraC family transcriptional regulator [Marinicaulis sp.]